MSQVYEWEEFNTPNGDNLRRVKVPGGWLYQVEWKEYDGGGRVKTRGWHPPTFVPGKSVRVSTTSTAP